MNGEMKFYFQFKPNIRQTHGQPVLLKDVIELSAPLEVSKGILDTIVVDSKNKEPVVITAMDVIRVIQATMPDAEIYLVGDGKTLIEVSDSSPNSNSKLHKWVKLVISGALTFIGSGLAIMYFHADVNMHEVHQTIFSVVTGTSNSHPYIVSIPYSLGIGVGIALFFDIFSFGKKKNNPGPLELELYNYEKDVYLYIRDEEEKEDESK